MDFDNILAINKEKFNNKWGRNREARKIMGIPIPTLGAALIVKNEEGCIERCLKSLQGVDEIVVVDTGSTDNTCNIVRKYTDKCYEGEYKWDDNFAEARNVALSHCTTDWVISIDADETLDEGGVSRIKEIIYMINMYFDAIMVLMHHGDDQFYNTKVFRSHLRYTGKVHEYILPTDILENSGVGIEFNISESHTKDPDRNIRILESEARKDPFNPRTQYCMMREYFILGYFPNAIYWGERYRVSVEKLGLCDAEYADAMFTLALCYENMMDYPKAIGTCMECIATNADFKEACEMMARLAGKTGNMMNQDRWVEFSITAQNRGLNFKTKGQF
jgi:glycosyltransferase involved in cell wall biosynthesis